MLPASKQTLVLAGAAALVLFLASRAGQVVNTINGLRFSLGWGGAPRVSGMQLVWPVLVHVDNPGLAELPLQGVGATIERLQADGSAAYVAGTPPEGNATPPIAARGRTSFTLDLTTSGIAVIAELAAIFRSRGLGRYRLLPMVRVAGANVNLEPQILTY